MLLTSYFLSLWGGSIRFNTPMLFALAFLPMFGIGGLTGLPLGLAASDIYLHDTYYVIGHFHYVVAPGTIFALFAGIYYWFPKMTGKKMNEMLGKLHFWPSLVFMNGIFMPMFIQGLAGVSRRLADGGVTPAVGPGLRIDVLNRPRDAVVVAEARLAPADAVLVVLRAAKLRLDLRTMVCGLRTR